MKKFLLALSLIIALASLVGCSDCCESGGAVHHASQLYGTWVMTSFNGQTCTGCVVLTLAADRTFTVTDTQGIVLDAPGKKTGTYDYHAGRLRLKSGGFEYEGTVDNYTGNSVKIGFGTYAKS